MGMTVMVIGWLYLFGGLSGGRRIVAASVLDRVVFVPVPLAIAGVFPHFLLAFAVLDPTLGIGDVPGSVESSEEVGVAHLEPVGSGC
jgi:hypothetical protein